MIKAMKVPTDTKFMMMKAMRVFVRSFVKQCELHFHHVLYLSKLNISFCLISVCIVTPSEVFLHITLQHDPVFHIKSTCRIHMLPLFIWQLIKAVTNGVGYSTATRSELEGMESSQSR